MAKLTIEMVETAIQEVLINQSYEIYGRKYTRADLEGLRALRKELKAELKDGGDVSVVLPKGAYRVSFN